nr:hypothetical protein [Nanoarchaeum sp.]
MTNQEHKGRAKKTLDLFFNANRDATPFLYEAGKDILDYPHYHLKLEFNLDRGQIYGLVRDTRIGLALYQDFEDGCENSLVSSVCGFTVESEDTVRVRQLQRRPNITHQEMIPDWKTILIKAYENWATANNFRISQIQRAEVNKRYRHDRLPEQGINLRLKNRYDLTAVHTGYKLENGVWTKKLDPIPKHH